MFWRNKQSTTVLMPSMLLCIALVVMMMLVTTTATATDTGTLGVGGKVEDGSTAASVDTSSPPDTTPQEGVDSDDALVAAEESDEKAADRENATASDDSKSATADSDPLLLKEGEVPLAIEMEESIEQKANSYQMHRRHFRTPAASSSDNLQGDDPALGIDHPDYSSEKELYRQRSTDIAAALDGGASSSSDNSVVVEETPIDLPCHLLNEEQVRREQRIYPIVLNYTDALANIVNLLQDLREQYTAEHHYVCPADKMSELRTLLNVLGELQYFHTRRDKLRLLGGKSFGTLGPLCASHIIVASDVFKTWAVAIETVYNGISASEGHCTTGWANFLAFLSNAPGLQEPQLRTPECMKRPSYARCFLDN